MASSGRGLIVVACLVLVGADQGADKDEIKKAVAGLPKLAAAIDKAGPKFADSALVKKLVAGLAKLDFDAVMAACGPRKDGGFGFGPKTSPKLDGIEDKLKDLAKKPLTAQQLGMEAPALLEMAYRIAAVNEVTIAQTPANNQGKKTVKTWKDTSVEVRKAFPELAAAVQAGNPALVQKAAGQLDTACQKCHGEWK
jgi:hypothetical protein